MYIKTMERFLHSRDYRSLLWRWLNTVDRLMMLSAMFPEGKLRGIVDDYIRAERYMRGDELLEQVVSGGVHTNSEDLFWYIYGLRGYNGWDEARGKSRPDRYKAPPPCVFRAALAGGVEYLNKYNDCAEGKYDEFMVHEHYLTMCSCVRAALGYCARVGDYALFLRLVHGHPLYDVVFKVISSCTYVGGIVGVDISTGAATTPTATTKTTPTKTCDHVIPLVDLVLYLVSVRAEPLMQRVMSWNVGVSIDGIVDGGSADRVEIFRSQDTFVKFMIEVAIFSDNTELFTKYWTIPHDRLRIYIPAIAPNSRGKILTQMIIDEKVSIAEINKLSGTAWLDAWTKMRELGLAVGGISWSKYDSMDYETNKRLIRAGIIKHGRLIVGCPKKFLLNLELVRSCENVRLLARGAAGTNDNLGLGPEIVDIPEVYPLYLSSKNIRFSDFEECMRLVDLYGINYSKDGDFIHECLLSNDPDRLNPYLSKYA
jgi:hypothetical protein